MNKAETAFLLQKLIAIFPGAKMTADELTISAWQELLADLPRDLALCAVQKIGLTKAFPPSPSEIRSAAQEIVSAAEDRDTAGEAWAKVRRAIREYGFYRPEKAREALGDEIWDTVGMIGGWSEICISDAGSAVLSAQFARRYEEARKKKDERLLIPAPLRNEMNRLAGAMAGKLLTEGAAGDEKHSGM